MQLFSSSQNSLRHQVWWQLALFIAVGCAAVLIGNSFQKRISNYMPEYGTNTSSFNRKPSGYSGLYELLRKTGLKAQQWQLPYRHLPEINGTMLIFAPRESLEHFEIKQLLSWVEKGNALVYLDDFTFDFERRFLTRMGLGVFPGRSLNDEALVPDSQQPVFQHVKELIIRADSRLSQGQALLRDESGVLLAQVSHGKGKILFGVMPSLCSNERLRASKSWGNFQFLYNWLSTRNGGIYFDEFAHGYNQGTNVFIYLSRGPAGLLSAQLLLLLFIAIVSKSQRFGRTSVLERKRSISNIEFISGLANTYQRAKATVLSFDILHHAFRVKLCKALNLSTAEPNEVLAERWSQTTYQNSSQLQSYLDASSKALNQKQLSEHELVEMVAACDKISEHCRELFARNKGTSIHGSDS